MADLQEIVKTHPKSYPSYFHTYPRNGKTTVMTSAKQDVSCQKLAFFMPILPQKQGEKWLDGIRESSVLLYNQGTIYISLLVP